MTSSLASVTTSLKSTVDFLNNPSIKSGIKITIEIGVIACGLCVYARDGYSGIDTPPPEDKSWRATAKKIAIYSIHFSIISSYIILTPGKRIISFVVHRIFTETQLTRFFGPNTIFEVNPWHPRHVSSLIVFAAGIPAVILTINSIWSRSEFLASDSDKKREGLNFPSYLKESHIQKIACVITLLSRPALHIGNAGLGHC